jgi:sec-independent protein translocase protein TatA
MPDMAVIMAVVLIIFGPGKLPEIGKSLGKSIRDFKKATELDPIDPKPKAESVEAGSSNENR